MGRLGLVNPFLKSKQWFFSLRTGPDKIVLGVVPLGLSGQPEVALGCCLQIGVVYTTVAFLHTVSWRVEMHGLLSFLNFVFSF